MAVAETEEKKAEKEEKHQEEKEEAIVAPSLFRCKHHIQWPVIRIRLLKIGTLSIAISAVTFGMFGYKSFVYFGILHFFLVFTLVCICIAYVQAFLKEKLPILNLTARAHRLLEEANREALEFLEKKEKRDLVQKKVQDAHSEKMALEEKEKGRRMKSDPVFRREVLKARKAAEAAELKRLEKEEKEREYLVGETKERMKELEDRSEEQRELRRKYELLKRQRELQLQHPREYMDMTAGEWQDTMSEYQPRKRFFFSLLYCFATIMLIQLCIWGPRLLFQYSRSTLFPAVLGPHFQWPRRPVDHSYWADWKLTFGLFGLCFGFVFDMDRFELHLRRSFRGAPPRWLVFLGTECLKVYVVHQPIYFLGFFLASPTYFLQHFGLVPRDESYDAGNASFLQLGEKSLLQRR